MFSLVEFFKALFPFTFKTLQTVFLFLKQFFFFSMQYLLQVKRFTSALLPYIMSATTMENRGERGLLCKHSHYSFCNWKPLRTWRSCWWRENVVDCRISKKNEGKIYAIRVFYSNSARCIFRHSVSEDKKKADSSISFHYRFCVYIISFSLLGEKVSLFFQGNHLQINAHVDCLDGDSALIFGEWENSLKRKKNMKKTSWWGSTRC